MSQGELYYESPWLASGESVAISFDVAVKDNADFGGIIENSVILSAYFKEWSTPIIHGRMSDVLQAEIQSQVPEPSSIILLGLGLFLWAVLQRKCSHK
jgi:hypothetical protein